MDTEHKMIIVVVYSEQPINSQMLNFSVVLLRQLRVSLSY